jgi:hypothetical protein
MPPTTPPDLSRRALEIARNRANSLADKFRHIAGELDAALRGEALQKPAHGYPDTVKSAEELAALVGEVWAAHRRLKPSSVRLMSLCEAIEEAERSCLLLIKRGGEHPHHEHVFSRWLRALAPDVVVPSPAVDRVVAMVLPDSSRGVPVSRKVFWSAACELARSAGFKVGSPGALRTRYGRWVR